MKQFFTRRTVKVATPIVPVPVVTNLPVTNSVPWQRIALSIIGIIIVMFMWRWATFHLYSLPVTSITAFTSITNNSLYVIAALVVFFVTGKLVYDWKNQTVSQIVQEAQNITEEHTEISIPPKAFDDSTIP